MRFLMLNWRDPKSPHAGGAERVTLGYLSALVKRGHEVSWFSYDFPGAVREEVMEGIQVVRGGGKGSAIRYARNWYRFQPKFDLVIDQHHGIPWYAPWWCGTNCVGYIHEVLGPIWNAFYRWPLATVGQIQERWTHWLYRNVQFFTASESTRAQLMRHGVKNVQIIPYGVHTAALPALEEKSLTQPLKLVVVSRLAPNKRIEHGIETLAELRKMGITAELCIVGGGEWEPVLRERVQTFGLANAVTFAGPLPEKEKDELLRRSHILLHTSQREGWGLNVIEANAMGTPAAVYPVPGLIESTIDNVTGIISHAETPTSLAARIAKLAATPAGYHRFRHAAWERSKEFHWSRVLPIACDWFEQMAVRKR